VPDQPRGQPQWRPRADTVDITVDGVVRSAPAGSSIAAALIASGQPGWRRTRRRGELRGLSCGMGACFDCLITVNGTPGVRACLTDVRAGDVITTEEGSGFAGRAV
jgi:predicted molibdopterin-dependent oxidoreductase YjgC